MGKLTPLSTEDQKMIESLAEFVDDVKNNLCSKTIYINALKPKQFFILSMYAAVNSYTEAIHDLCKLRRPEAAIVILRSITEAWINSVYILSSTNDRALHHYALEGSYNKKSLVQQFREFYEKYPKLRTAVLTDEALMKMEAIAMQELQNYKVKINIDYANKNEFKDVWGDLYKRSVWSDTRLKKRQKDKAGGIEHTYMLVYRYLSDYTHLSVTGLEHFWTKDTHGSRYLTLDKNPEKLDMILATNYSLYLYFAAKLKQYNLIDSSLSKYTNFFDKNILKKNKQTAPDIT